MPNKKNRKTKSTQKHASKGSKRSKRSCVDELPPAPKPPEGKSTLLITNHLFAKKKVLQLRQKHDRTTNDLILYAFEEMDYINGLDLTIASPDEIQIAYTYYVAKFMRLTGEVGNRGQLLSTSSHGVAMCFAINESIKYKLAGLGNRMDDDACCLEWQKRHWLYSILLSGGTDSELFTTDMAAAFSDANIDLWDSMSECCRKTKSDKKGNKYRTMRRQLERKTESFGGGIKGTARMDPWLIMALNNEGWRVAYHAARTRGKTPYKILHMSSRNLELFHELNPSGDVQRNEWVVMGFVCHVAAMMSKLPNALVHTKEKVERYTVHSHEFLEDFDGMDFQGISIKVPPLIGLEYFKRRALWVGYDGITQAEYDARMEVLRKNYEELQENADMMHLAAVLTREYDDLSKLSSVDLGKLPTNEDRSKYQRLLKKYGSTKKLWKELAKVRDMWDNSKLKQHCDMSHLAAVLTEEYGDLSELSSVDLGKLPTNEDRSKYQRLLKKYGSTKKLWKELAKVRDMWDNSKLKQHCDMSHLAAVLTEEYGDLSELSSVDLGNLPTDGDRSTYQRLLKEHGDKKELWKELAKVRDVWDNSKWKQHCDMSHLAAVLTQEYGDLSELSIVDLDNLPTDGDRSTYQRLLKEHGDKKELWKELAKVRDEWDNSKTKVAFEQHNSMQHLASQWRRFGGDVSQISEQALTTYLSLLQSLDVEDDDTDMEEMMTEVINKCIDVGNKAYANRVKNTKQVTVSVPCGQSWLERDALKTAVADGSFVALSPGKGGAIKEKIFKDKRIVLDAARLKLDAEAAKSTLRSFGVGCKDVISRFGTKHVHYLLTGDNTLSYDANVVWARTHTIPVIKLQMLEDVLLEKISLEEMIRLGLENEQLE